MLAAHENRARQALGLLERILQPELGNAPDRRRGDFAESGTTCEVPVRIIQIGMIEGVEQFRAELKLTFFVNREQPEE